MPVQKRQTILVAAFGHETNGISQLPTGLREFEAYLLALGNDIPATLENTSHEIAGVIQVAESYSWDLVFTIAGYASPSGPVTREAWSYFADTILGGLNTPVDGVFLALHGAMATQDHLDAEGELLHLIRQKVGPRTPIAVTLDLHANVTEDMVKFANIIVPFRTYPHVDQVETARRAAAILNRAIVTGKTPRTLLAKRNISTGLDDGRTTCENPMTTALRWAEKIEQQNPEIAVIGLNAGFNLCALPGAGPSVTVTYWDQKGPAQRVAEDLMDYIEETHDFDSNDYLSVEEAMVQARMALSQPGVGPVILADFSDNPGAGAYGDATSLPAGLIAADLGEAAIGSICDPEAVEKLYQAGLGATVTISLGGKIDAILSPPLTVTGTVIRFSDGQFVASGPFHHGGQQNLGKTAVLRVGRIDIVVVSILLQCTDPEHFSHIGINPNDKQVLVVKSMHHFRAAFEPISRRVLVVDSGAMAGPLAAPHYERLRMGQPG